MKRVLVLQHMDDDGPAYLGLWLAREGIEMTLRNSAAGDEFPATLDGHTALAILGGAMSANDDLPSLRRAEDLIRQAVRRGVPVLGHCLGGQLMARALGGSVTRSPAPEIGWRTIEPNTELQARAAVEAWFGASRWPAVFHWHYEAFTLPPGAVALAGNAACPVQAFAIGPHLAMQFHVEIDALKLASWSAAIDVAYQAAQRAHPDTVQGAAAMLAQAGERLMAQQRLADRIYRRWMAAAA